MLKNTKSFLNQAKIELSTVKKTHVFVLALILLALPLTVSIARQETNNQSLAQTSKPAVEGATTTTTTSSFWKEANGILSPINANDTLSFGGVVPNGGSATIYAASGNRTNYGIFGTNNDGGAGVYGLNTAYGNGIVGGANKGDGVSGGSAQGNGVHGVANAADAAGVYGVSLDDQGKGKGVSGLSYTGVGGYFVSNLGYSLVTGKGNVGLGVDKPQYELDLAGNNTSGPVSRIFNNAGGTTSDGLVIKLGNTSTSQVTTGNQFVTFATSGIGNVGSIRGNGAKGTQYATSGNADFAEYFDKDANTNIEFGSLVCLDSNGMVMLCNNDNSNILGVSSEHPTFVGGDNNGSKSVPVALVGKVMLKVKGDIRPGDALGVSDTSGVATKVTNGPIVGRALKAHSGSEVDKILVVVSPSL